MIMRILLQALFYSLHFFWGQARPVVGCCNSICDFESGPKLRDVLIPSQAHRGKPHS